MKPNKSIDGLITRSAKSGSAKVAKPSSAPVRASTKTPTKTPSPSQSLIPDDALEISLTSSLSSPQTPPKPKTKSAPKQKPTTQKPSVASDTTQTAPLEPTANAEDFLSPLEPLDIDKKPMKSQEKANAKKLKKKPSKLRLMLRILALVIIIALIASISGIILWGNDIIAKITGGQGNVLDLLTFTEETYEPLKTDANGRTNILAFGTSGYNMEGDEGNGVHAGAQLTDSIMMISLNQETGDIAMLSLPRDLKASPTCTATGKINEIYWCNGGSGTASIDQEAKAANALMTEVGSILGVDFQYFAHLNWGSLVYIVDTLGGITVTLDEDIHDYYWTGAVFEAGVPYTINGEQALGLARARHGTTGGDFSRGSSQQKILIGIKDKVFEKELSITDLLGLAGSLGDNLRTNFSLPEIKTLAHLTYIYDLDNIRQINLVDYDRNIYYMTTGTINGISYVLPSAGVGNYGAIQSYVATNLSNDPRTYETPTILVLNATETPGLAAAEQAALTEAGFANVEIADAPTLPEGDSYPTGTTIYAISSKPGSQNLLELHYLQKSEPSTSLPEAISRDYDFVIILNPAEE